MVSDFKTQLGQALKQQRQRRKLSQSKLAELADVSDRYIADIEAGKANLTMKVLDRAGDGARLGSARGIDGGRRAALAGRGA